MTVGVARRLPGFQFEVQPPPLNETLPRLDIAAFVGFAASGPLHTPVVVEDPSQFAAIFGQDATLAWDSRRGRRCWPTSPRQSGPSSATAGSMPGSFEWPGLARS